MADCMAAGVKSIVIHEVLSSVSSSLTGTLEILVYFDLINLHFFNRLCQRHLRSQQDLRVGPGPFTLVLRVHVVKVPGKHTGELPQVPTRLVMLVQDLLPWNS